MAGNTTVSTAPAGYSAEIAELIRSSLTPRRMQEKLSSYHENDVASALELLRRNGQNYTRSWTQKPWQGSWNTPIILQNMYRS